MFRLIVYLCYQKWYSEFNNNIEEFQNYLLNQTFDNPLFSSWSLRVKYRETFIKTIIKWVRLFDYNQLRISFYIQIETYNNSEVNSRWYELIADLASRGSCEQDWCHTIYILVSENFSIRNILFYENQDNNQFVIHRQSTSLLSHGLTGLSSWPASICLGDYLMKRIHLVENKYSIEKIFII